MISYMYVSIFITNEQLNYHWELPNDRQFFIAVYYGTVYVIFYRIIYGRLIINLDKKFVNIFSLEHFSMEKTESFIIYTKRDLSVSNTIQVQ